MTGREEKAVQYNKRTENLLEGKPQYLKDYYKTLYELSHMTKYRYVKYIINFLEFLERDYGFDVSTINFVEDVKPSMLKAYFSSLEGKSDSFKASCMYGVKKFFSYCFDDEIINKNPFDRVVIPADKKEHDIIDLNKDEIKLLLNNIMNEKGVKRQSRYHKQFVYRDKAIVMLGLFLAMRVSSIAELNVSDVHLEEKTITIREKGGKERELGYSDGLKKDLEEWLEQREAILYVEGKSDMEALFISNQLNRISVDAISGMLKRCTEGIGKHITPHKLRSTCVTRICEETGNIQLAAYVAGHSSLKNTKRYARLTDKTKEKAVSVMTDVLYK